MSEGNTVNTKSFAKALKRGTEVAYDVVTHPKEGTILTVVRMVGEYAVKVANKQSDFWSFSAKSCKRRRSIGFYPRNAARS